MNSTGHHHASSCFFYPSNICSSMLEAAPFVMFSDVSLAIYRDVCCEGHKEPAQATMITLDEIKEDRESSGIVV